ncbi:MAG: hypothetical protein J0H15_12250 [Xanthomonadales bacterium]|nr:hypothetical protein [Xanthomonadales bacterium]
MDTTITHSDSPSSAAWTALHPRSPGVEAQVWVEARHFFSRSDAQQHCWLWLLGRDRRVHTLRLEAARFGEERLSARLRVRLARAEDEPSPLAGGSVAVLRDAPVVPVPRWAVSWGHPLQHAIRAFAGRLDQEVLDLLGWLEAPGPFFGSVGNYNRLVTLPEPVRTHRLQALRRFPALVPRLLLDMGGYPDMFGRDSGRSAWLPPSTHEVLDAIDRGRDLTGALAAHYGIRRALVRSPLLARPWCAGYVPREVLSLLDALPPEARPQSPAEVEPRLDALRALRLDLGDGGATAHAARLFAGGWNAVWQSLEARVPGRLEPALRDTVDFLRAALAEGLLPPALAELDETDLGAAWLARRGPLSLLDASLRWHAQPQVASPARIGDGLPDALTPLMGTLEAPQAGTARELATREALMVEGLAMQHCVGSYWRTCVLYGDRIFHLDGEEGERATAMYSPEVHEGDIRYELRQLRGPRNAEVSAAIARLAARVMGEINREERFEQRLDVREESFGHQDRHAARSDAQVARPVRTLDPRSRQELRLVLGWCQRHASLVARPATLYEGTIAGFRHAEGPRLIDRLGAGDSIELVREPHNPYDPHAVRVDWNGRKLGYVPRAENAPVAQRLDAGEALAARIVRVQRGGDAWEVVLIGIVSAEAPEQAHRPV